MKCPSSSSSHHSSTKSKTKQTCRRLLHPEVLSQLFMMEADSLNDHDEEYYSDPLPESIILEKHQEFAKQIETTLSIDPSPFSFTKTNLQLQIQYRMVPLTAVPYSDQVRRSDLTSRDGCFILPLDRTDENIILINNQSSSNQSCPCQVSFAIESCFHSDLDEICDSCGCAR